MPFIEIAQSEFDTFYHSIKDFFGIEPIHFDGRSFSNEFDEGLDWTFCLVNRNRERYLFVPKHIAFFFINLALYNISPLPNSLTTSDISCDRLHYLYHRYHLQQQGLIDYF
jgi:hypothetical protein